jgi:arabinose-5-phosphate isomerase
MAIGLDTNKLKSLALSVIKAESRAIDLLTDRIDDQFVGACELLLNTQGRIVVVGIGKSGHIGRKLAATLASTGSAAFFVNAAEAQHGDLGMICAQDVVIFLSNSGQSEELVTLLSPLKRLGVPIVALTGNLSSSLAASATVTLNVSVEQEACPLGLAPTTSTAAMLAMGDALAIALLDAKGFDKHDFARSHPGGKLGKQLLLKVADVMRTGEYIPHVHAMMSLKQGLLEVSKKGLGMTAIVDQQNTVLGIFTDGDLRRTLDAGLDIHATTMSQVMTTHCRTIMPDQLAVDALALMQDARINALPVVDEQKHLVGALNMHDLLTAGVV